MLLQDISQIDPLPRHPVRNHRDRDQEPNPVHGWNGKLEGIALEAHTLKSDRPSKRAWRRSMAISSKPTSRYRILAARFNEVSQFPDVARATNAALARIHSGEVRHLWRHARMYRCRLARVVDHMADHTVIAQRHGDHVVEPYLRTLRRLDCPG